MFGIVSAGEASCASRGASGRARRPPRRTCRGSRGSSSTSALRKTGSPRRRARPAAAAPAAPGRASQRRNCGSADPRTRERHVRVLQPAELGALAAVAARRVGVEHDRVLLARESCRSCGSARGTQKLWITSAVVHDDAHRCPRRDVDLVGRDRRRAGVAHLPPPLVADDVDRQAVVASPPAPASS